MNYQESREYIDRVTREIPSVLGLDHMREMMKRLGNPQDDLKYVQCSRHEWQRICHRISLFCVIRSRIPGRQICIPNSLFLQRKNWRFQERGSAGTALPHI